MLKTFKIKFIDVDGYPNERLYETDNIRQFLEYLSTLPFSEGISSIQEVKQ